MAPDMKTTLTVSTLSGDVTADYPPHQKLKIVVAHVVTTLGLVASVWILDKDGVPLDLESSIEEAGLVDGDILTLSPEEGGGGSCG